MKQARSPGHPVAGRRKVAWELIGPRNVPLAYFNMPKAGCTTIKNILYYVEHGCWHNDPLAIHKDIRFKDAILRGRQFAEHRESQPFQAPFITFSFVRNPALRAYSAFVEKIWANGPYCFPAVRKLLRKNHHYRLNPLETGRFEPKDVTAGFKAFLRFVGENLAGNTTLAPNAHWAVQFNRLRRLGPQDWVGFVGRVESFEHDMSFVLRKAGWEDVSIAGRRFNEGPKPPFELDEIVDEEIVEIMMTLYRNDFLAFDYPHPGRFRLGNG